jgi:hypothetical protein
MQQIPKTVSITDLRKKTKKIIKETINSNEPCYIIYNSQIPVCLVSKEYLAKCTSQKQTNKNNIDKYAGFLKASKAFKEGALNYQKKIRSQWNN